MSDKPIIFSGPMVRALLDGRKTQTRRVIRGVRSDNSVVLKKSTKTRMGICTHVMDGPTHPEILPIRAVVGDRLYVREAFCPRLGYPAPVAKPHYRADDDKPEWRGLWKPSIHMPRWASRLTLTVTDVRVERLQDISRGDAMGEGCPFANMAAGPDPRAWFSDLWGTIHSVEAWCANPWVAAYTFTVERRNIDA